MPRILITGCAGFIGSNLTKKCLAEGWDVVGVDDLSNGHLDFLPDDFRHDDEACWRVDFVSKPIVEMVRSKRFDAVVHLAANPRVSFSVENPVASNDVNVTKTLQLMEACRGNIDRFVFASSSAVYGAANQLPTSNVWPKLPKSPYGLQKSIIEDYLTLYKSLYDMDSVSLRFFNVFGRNQLGDSPYSTAVSAWLTAIKRDVSMRSDGDGSQSRDMCHVDNVVDACMRSVTHPRPLEAEALNVACGTSTTNKQILDMLKARYPSARHHDAPWRVGDVMHTQADISRTTQVLGYVPVVSFEDGLEDTAAWYDAEWDRIKDLGGDE